MALMHLLSFDEIQAFKTHKQKLNGEQVTAAYLPK